LAEHRDGVATKTLLSRGWAILNEHELYNFQRLFQQRNADDLHAFDFVFGHVGFGDYGTFEAVFGNFAEAFLADFSGETYFAEYVEVLGQWDAPKAEDVDYQLC
jgi:hypothetical protein